MFYHRDSTSFLEHSRCLSLSLHEYRENKWMPSWQWTQRSWYIIHWMKSWDEGFANLASASSATNHLVWLLSKMKSFSHQSWPTSSLWLLFPLVWLTLCQFSCPQLIYDVINLQMGINKKPHSHNHWLSKKVFFTNFPMSLCCSQYFYF